DSDRLSPQLGYGCGGFGVWVRLDRGVLLTRRLPMGEDLAREPWSVPGDEAPRGLVVRSRAGDYDLDDLLTDVGDVVGVVVVPEPDRTCRLRRIVPQRVARLEEPWIGRPASASFGNVHRLAADETDQRLDRSISIDLPAVL